MVTSAYVEKTTMMQEANKYKDEKTMEASAIKNETIQNAKSYNLDKISQAQSNVSQFYALIDEYRKNPLIVKERIYHDKLNIILNKIGNMIILDEDQELENIMLP